ncbi:MAG TPA: hypothetical protein VJ508_20620 [Saprospiraceae bacterium]|nr:hypothetical protein [Saprospiraceae bacterium]
MKGIILFLLLIPSGVLLSQDSIAIPLGGRDIKILVQGQPHAMVLMYNMHDNENTAATAGRIISKEYGGEYFELEHEGKRLISFKLGEDSIHIDPNRIYTDTGIWLQLKRNKITDTLAFRTIAAWRDRVLSILDLGHRELVIALHNNTNQNYSFQSYLHGEDLEQEAEAVHKGDLPDNDDFYFVTDPRIMELLSQGRYHVILQSDQERTDDGSLSVYCAQRGIPYINIEVQYRRLIRQIKMLIFAFQQLVVKE